MIDLLRGRVKHEWLANADAKGTGSDLSVESWRAVVHECRANALVEDVTRETSSGHVYAALAVTTKGDEWLADFDSTLYGRPLPAAKRAKTAKTVQAPTAACDDELYGKLCAVRSSLAHDVPAYMVCSNETLRQLTQRRPRTEMELHSVPGFGKIKVAKYGPAFLECIRASISSS